MVPLQSEVRWHTQSHIGPTALVTLLVFSLTGGMSGYWRIWRWARGLVVGGFVVGFLTILLSYNIFNLIEPENFDPTYAPAWKKKCTYTLTALGTNQRWNMFAPNVATRSYSPVVVLQMKDGERIAIHSIVEPELPNWHGPGLIPNKVTGEARDYIWRLHLLDGRIRKLESKVIKPEFRYWKTRTIYARWQAQQWIADNPGRRKDIKRIELWRAKIKHPGEGRTLSCESTHVMRIFPQWDPLWPVAIDYDYPFYSAQP